MTFAYSYLLPLFIVGSLCLLIFLQRNRKKSRQLKALWGVVYENPSTLKQRLGVGLRRCCLILGIIAFLIALARPQWGEIFVKREQTGLNIIFAVDTSKSMLANDVRPNRLELAKMSILELLKSLKGNHVGLIAFAGNAFLQCPSTADHGAFKASLQALDTDIIPRGGTNISAAMTIAAQIFEPNAKYKQMLLLTDGENLEGDVLKMAQTMADAGIVVHTIGIGSAAGSPISISNARGMNEYLKGPDGKPIITKLDEKTLQAIAQTTQGFYAPLGNAGEGLQTIYETALKTLPKENFESVDKVPVERYALFAALALFFLLLESLCYTIKLKK